MRHIINLTGHNLNIAGMAEIPGDKAKVARVEPTFSEFVDGICVVSYGDIVGLPDSQPDTIFVVSALVLSAAKDKGLNRVDVVAPATGHPLAKKNEKGHILEVPGFVRM